MKGSPVKAEWLRISIGIFAIVFGLGSIKEGGSVLAGGMEACQAVQCVPFITWFNFLAGFAYIAAGVGFLKSWSWSGTLAKGIAGLTVLFFVGFGLHVLSDGVYATRTVIAMSFRSIIWIAIALISLRLWNSQRRLV